MYHCLDIHPVWSESSLCAQRVAKDPSFLHADSEDSDQTGRMPRMIWVFAGRTCHFVGFVMRRLKVAFYHCFSIDNDVNISSPCSKTVHTKFTKTSLILRGHPSPPIWSKNIQFLPNSVRHYLLFSRYTMSSHRIVLLIFLHRVH